ncbi:MAG: type II toxin-antitoxin system RelE/ParE family toxin [Bacteroidaceae bacterium]|nr:type II toxin-antitoxin system RelE/ParE family toxin [Bacteroidaceae bacterium]
MRTILRSQEFDEFYASLSSPIQRKMDYALEVITTIKVVNQKLIKKLIDSDFYELRINVGNEYRVILFTIDKENFIEAEQILLLNGFMKKSTKDYKREIAKAQSIIKQLSL